MNQRPHNEGEKTTFKNNKEVTKLEDKKKAYDVRKSQKYQ